MDKLYEVALNLYRKITTTNDWTFDDITLFNDIYHVLNVAGYVHVRELNKICKPNSIYMQSIETEMMEKYNKIDQMCRQFYFDIGAKVTDIFNQYYDNDQIVLADYDVALPLDKANKLISKYYHKVDFKNASDIKKLLYSDRIFIKKVSKEINVEANGVTATVDNDSYITVIKRNEDNLIDIQAIITLVHELGHSIGLKYSTTSAFECCDPLRELISTTHEFTFCKLHNKESKEYKKRIYFKLYTLKTGIDELYNDSKIIDYSFQPYTLSIYIGLYLSQLFISDRKKFNYLYNEIKKYIFTSDESKIFDLLLQEEQIKTGEFLKREIDDVQKIIH